MRRIVTENDAGGKSRIMQVKEVMPGKVIWESSAEQPLGFEPREVQLLERLSGGVKVSHLSLPIQAEMDEHLRRGIPGLDEKGFHRTGSLDFVLLLDGELTLDLDEESVKLEPGDVVVQRDTNHAWRNTGDKPARLLAVIVVPPAQPGKA